MATAKEAENERPSFYVTTPIYYVNDYPHIGHIYTTLVVDTMARWRRLRGERVYFLTGTDEHGQKIEKAAAEARIAPIALADQVVERYHAWWRLLGLSHDDFIRTTEERHHRGVLEIIRRIAERGDLYSSHHEGLYCVGCETFYTEKELLPGNRCPVHETVCEARSEDNVFFRLSAYQQALLDHYAAHPGFIQPESRRNEVEQFVAAGLKDLSVSRTNVTWGIPFPDHPGHTVYVWLDALTNYITALGFGQPGGEGAESGLYHQLWADGGERIHVVGKDILRFHAVYWPAFLMSAGLPLPTTVWAHGWWLRDGKKMSKSVGNVVRPDHLVERFGADPLRYFLLREMTFGQDGGFSDEGFVDRYNSDLANDLGNTLSRVVTVSRKAFADHLPPRRGDALEAAAATAVAEYRSAMDEWAFQDALKALWRLLQETNQYLVVNEPWKRLADPAQLEAVAEVLWSSAEALRIIATGLLPFLPEQAPKLLAALQSASPKSDAAMAWGGLATGAPLPAVEPLFPRVDKKLYLAEIAATVGGIPHDTAATPAAPPPKKKEKKVSETSNDSVAVPAAAPAAETAAPAGPATITIDQFMAVELKVAAVRAAERVPKSDKLLKLTVDVGEGADRTVVAGIGKQYTPEELVGRQVVVVANLAPAKLMGVESNGMVLAASPAGLPVLLRPLEEVPPGTRVR